MSAVAASRAGLSLVRLPGEFGPIVRCAGELSVRTAEALRRELELLGARGQPAVVLNLTECGAMDTEGILTLLEAYRRLRLAGRRLVLVTGESAAARLLAGTGIDVFLPTFLTERAALTALRGGAAPEPPPRDWEAARADSLRWWRALHDALGRVPAGVVLPLTGSPSGLCARAQAELGARLPGAEETAPRCVVCPLFAALGSRPEDIGCRSVYDPLAESLAAGDRDGARAQIVRLINLIEHLPLTGDGPR